MALKNIDTSKLIFDELYLCKIPNYKTMSADYIKIFGTPTTFIPEIDNQLQKELITVMLSIDRMIEYYKEGIIVRIVKESDIVPIYDAISLHLNTWKENLQKGLNIKNAPMEDFIIMDQFAQAIYPYASKHFSKSQVDSILGRNVGSKFGNLNEIMNKINKNIEKNTKAETKEETNVNNSPERVSMADFFKGQTMGIKKWPS